MKATGTNTDSSTRVMAMIGPVIWPHRLEGRLGRRHPGVLPSTRSTFFHHHDGIVDTMPIASTMGEQPTRVGRVTQEAQHGEGAIRLTGTATAGMMVAAGCRGQEHDDPHQAERLGRVTSTSWMMSETNTVES